MKNYRFIIQYDGSRYDGWQKQGNTGNTIQGKLETLLERMAEHPVELHGAGRTDAGVHALGQIANARLNVTKSPEEILEYMNRYLPEDISVTAVSIADMRFHSRLHAVSKQYSYHIHNSAVKNPFCRKYSYQVEEALDIEGMKAAAGYLIGEHDFTSFCSNKRMKKSAVRTLYDIRIDKHEDDIEFTICGNGFLYNMVRIIVGTLLEIGQKKRMPAEVLDILQKKDRQGAGMTVPAQGLFLVKVTY